MCPSKEQFQVDQSQGDAKPPFSNRNVFHFRFTSALEVRMIYHRVSFCPQGRMDMGMSRFESNPVDSVAVTTTTAAQQAAIIWFLPSKLQRVV